MGVGTIRVKKSSDFQRIVALSGGSLPLLTLCKSLAVAACLLSLTVGPGVSAEPGRNQFQPCSGPVEYPHLGDPARFWDLDGRAGLVDKFLYGEEGIGTFELEDGRVFTRPYIGHTNAITPGLAKREPYLIIYRTPLLMGGRPVVSWGRAEYDLRGLCQDAYRMTHYDLLPISMGELGWTADYIAPPQWPAPPGYIVGSGTSCFVADSLEYPAFCIAGPLPNHLPLTVETVYLEGNSLHETVGQDQVQVTNWENSSSVFDVYVHWGQASSNEGSSGYVRLREEYPLGDTLLRLTLEGHHPSEGIISIPEQTDWLWNAAFAKALSEPADSVSQSVGHEAPPDWIIRRALELMVAEDAVLITHVWSHCDINGDGERDAADLEALRQQQGREEWNVY